jgi:GTP-binding protein
MTTIRQLLQQADYTTSVHETPQLPPDDGIEVAIAGRSNCGKSSLINRVCGRKELARTSGTPGRTRQLVFFRLDDRRRLVDLPGYGFAAVGADLKRHWQGLIQRYLERRAALAGVVLVMDIRHPLKDLDVQLAEFALDRGLALHAVLTKADKLGRGRRAEALRRVRVQIGDAATVQVFSSMSGEGVDELQAVLAAWLQVDADSPTGHQRR